MDKLKKTVPALMTILGIGIRYGLHMLSSPGSIAYIGADAADYALPGGTAMEIGHFLTVRITRVLADLFPTLHPVIYPCLFGGALLFALAFFLRDRVDMRILFFLFPFAGLVHWQLLGMAVYAQLFSLSLFLVAAGLYLEDRRGLSAIFFPLSILAHFWAGCIMAAIFVSYLLLGGSGIRRTAKISLPSMAVVGAISFAFPGILPVNVHSGDLAYFLSRVVRINLGLVFFSLFGVWKVSEIWDESMVELYAIWTAALIGGLMVLFCHPKRLWSLVPLFPIAVGGADYLKRESPDLFCWGILLTVASTLIFV